MIEMLDHTADVGSEPGAFTLEGLFDEARRTLLTVVFERPPDKDGREVLLSAPDLETLLVRRLNELSPLVRDAADVIEATRGAGIGHRVARLRSLIVVKG